MNRTLVREVIYPAYRWVKHDKVIPFLEDMHRIERATPDEIRDFQWRKLRDLVAHASTQVPYYRSKFRELGLTVEDLKEPGDLAALPVLRKQDIRDNLADLVAENYDRRYLQPDETGGSTGRNLFFYTDRRATSARLANNRRMNEWIGIHIGDRLASLWGIRFRVSRGEKIKSMVRDWINNTIYISAYKMDTETVEAQLARLARFRPDLVIGFPSVLHHFAQTIGERGLRPARPRAILASGETLYDWQRAPIEEAFGSTVYNHYGCCEFGAVARECAVRDGLHIAAERVFIEAQPVAKLPSGEQVCELVITGLDNYGMPFIRYAIEDLGTVTWEPCSCGLRLPRLRSLAGRVYDVIQAPNGNFLGGTFWGHILKEGVERFQVVQEKLDEVTISVVPAGEFTDRTRRFVLDKVSQACGEAMKVRIDIRSDLEMTPTGKHRYVISKVPLRK